MALEIDEVRSAPVSDSIAPRWQFLDHPGPVPFAHRGDHRDPAAPENSMAAFEAAVRLGYRYLETDVRATSDHVLVTFHDRNLDRLTDRSGRLDELPWREVQQARLAGDQHIPLLEDVLGAWPEVRVNIDPKHEAAVAPLVDVLKRTQAFDRVCVASFSDRRVTEVRRLSGGKACTALSPLELARLALVSVGFSWRSLPAPCVQGPRWVGRIPSLGHRLMATAHRLGAPVYVWTVNDVNDMAHLLDAGVDGLMTDRPDLLKHTLVQRGQWYE